MSYRLRRNGKDEPRRWWLDIPYGPPMLRPNGKTRQKRYKGLAKIQNQSGAKAEHDQLVSRIVETGSPYLAPVVQTRKVLTLGKFYEGKFTELYMPGFRASTAYRYRKVMELYILPALARTPLDQIDSQTARRLIVSIPANRPGQRCKTLNLLKTLMRCAHSSGEIPAPVKWETMRDLVPDARKLPRGMTEAQCRQVLSKARGWVSVALTLAIRAGLRGGEIRALRVEDIDFEERLIWVRRALSLSVEYDRTKGNRDRKVPIPDGLYNLLRETCRDRLPKARVLETRIGRTPSQQMMYLSLRGIQEKLNFPKLHSFHALRHSYLSFLVRGNANIEAVRVVAGHSDLKTTLRYIHANTDDMLKIRDLTSGLEESQFHSE